MSTTHDAIKGPLQGRPVRDILKELNAALTAMGLEGEGPFTDLSYLHQKSPKWPSEFRWMGVYPVRGSNEGWYIHIDVLSKLDPESGFIRYAEATHVATMKVLVEETAWQIARATAKLLDRATWS